MDAFHEVRFPLDIALGIHGGPERKTDIVTTGSGREERNARWAHSRRKYDAGFAVKSVQALSEIVQFFEERRGQLVGFRLRDRLDHKSCYPNATPAPLDQSIGTGDGATATFQLRKRYGSLFAPYDRPIRKPVGGTITVAVNGLTLIPSLHFDVETATGLVTFRPGSVPAAGAAITAGYQFDVPVRFDTDFLDIDLSAFDAGAIPKIPLIELIV